MEAFIRLLPTVAFSYKTQQTDDSLQHLCYQKSGTNAMNLENLQKMLQFHKDGNLANPQGIADSKSVL